MELKNKSKKTLLIISQYYWPEPNVKSYPLGVEMVKNGFDVISLTGFPNYPEGKIYKGYRQRLWKKEIIDGITVIRVPQFIDHSKSMIRRSLNYLSFSFFATIIGLMLVGKVDLIWAYHPPLTVAIPTFIISRLRRRPFVYEIQDMWPETLFATGMTPPRWIMNIFIKFSKFIYKKSVALTVISPGFKKNLIDKGVPSKKIKFIPNWAEEDIFFPIRKDFELLKKFKLKGTFNIIFAGTIGEAQGIENVIKAAEMIKSDKIKFILIGGGTDVKRLKILCKKKNIKNVLFIDRKPMSEINKYLNIADVLLINLKKDPLFEITIPSKTIAYLAVGKPILGVIRGDAKKIIEDSKSGLTCEPNNPNELAKNILKFYNMSEDDRITMGTNGRYYFLKNFKKSILVKQYINLFTHILVSNEKGKNT